ncbi:MAG: VanZ family protein [Verrucomicrobia bacterium]|nr:VanZ family protein [Verrucomicrobiota bacterium]
MRDRGAFLKYWLPVGIWMLVIFTGSTDLLSSQHTSRFIGPLLRWFQPDISDATIGRVQFVVRRTGHLTEYAVLAALLWRARRKPAPKETRPWCWREAGFALLVATFYAATDEFHQSFVPSREARVGDVALDSFGAALGLLVLWGLGRWRKRW